MAFSSTSVVSPALNNLLDQFDHAFYTDTNGNSYPIFIAATPDSGNNLNALGLVGQMGAVGNGTSGSNAQTHVNSTIDKMSKPTHFVTATGVSIPVIVFAGFDASGNVTALPLQGAVRAGATALGAIAASATSKSIAFTSALPTGYTYVPMISETNTVDGAPGAINPFIIAQSASGINVKFTATSTSNYILNYAIFPTA